MQKKCYLGCKVQGTLHTFPSPDYPHEDRFNQWKSVLKKDVINRGNLYIYGNIRLCGRHFEPCYQTRGNRLTANSVPTLNLSFVTEPDPAPIPPTKSGGHVPMTPTCNVSTLAPMPSMDNIISTSNICTNGGKVNQIQNTNIHNEVEVKYFGADIEADKRISEHLQGLGDTGESSRYVIEKILAKRFNMRCKQYEFLLKWKRHPFKQFTWAVEDDMGWCRHLIKDFEKQLMKQNKLKQSKKISAPPTVKKVDMKAATVTHNMDTSKVSAVKRPCDVEDSEPSPKVKTPAFYDNNYDFRWEHDYDFSMTKEINVRKSPKKYPNPKLGKCLSEKVLPETKTDSELPPDHNRPNVNTTEDLQEMVCLDVLVCGKCHSAFHFIKDFIEHKEANNCSETSPFRDCAENLTKVWGYILWKNSPGAQSTSTGNRAVDEWYIGWCRMPEKHRAVWVAAGNSFRALSQFTKHNITESDVRAQNVVDQRALSQLDTLQPKVTQKVNTNVIKLTNAIPQGIKQTIKQFSRPVSKIHIQNIDQINTQDKQAVEQNSATTHTHPVVKQTDKTARITRQRVPKLINSPINNRSTTKQILSSVVKKSGTAKTATGRRFTHIPHQEQRTQLMLKTSNHNETNNSEDCAANRSQSSENRVGLGKETETLSRSKDPPLMFRGEAGMLYRVEGGKEAGETLLHAVDDNVINFTRQESQDPLALVVCGGAGGEGTTHVTARLLRVHPPLPDGKRRVEFLLPDGNITIVKLDKEQYKRLKRVRS